MAALARPTRMALAAHRLSRHDKGDRFTTDSLKRNMRSAVSGTSDRGAAGLRRNDVGWREVQSADVKCNAATQGCACIRHEPPGQQVVVWVGTPCTAHAVPPQ